MHQPALMGLAQLDLPSTVARVCGNKCGPQQPQSATIPQRGIHPWPLASSSTYNPPPLQYHGSVQQRQPPSQPPSPPSAPCSIKQCYSSSEGDSLLRNSAHKTLQKGAKFRQARSGWHWPPPLPPPHFRHAYTLLRVVPTAAAPSGWMASLPVYKLTARPSTARMLMPRISLLR